MAKYFAQRRFQQVSSVNFESHCNEEGLTNMLWSVKLCSKLILSRLPISYAAWKAIGAFRHGRMDNVDYALEIFRLHTARAYPTGIPDGLVFLELGPGDSVASTLIACAHNAKQTYVVDVGRFAEREVSTYRPLEEKLRVQGFNVPNISQCGSLEEMLTLLRAEYMTNGLESLRSIPSQSVDFIWSHSVIEHVRKHQLMDVFRELKRILRPGGFASHNIDLQDHLDKSLNNLRFSEKIWESDFFANAGFYTNRVPAIRLHAMFREAGFDVCEEAFGSWDSLPIQRRHIHKEFQAFTDKELMHRTSHILLSA